MAVRIRLKRLGRLNRAVFRICVFDSRTRRDGPTIEEIGSYDKTSSHTETRVAVNQERARYWLSVGAQPTLIVRDIFKTAGVYSAENVAKS